MKKSITFLMVIMLLSLYAIPKVTKAFSFRDLLPNFSVRTDAKIINTVDTITKDSAVKDSKTYTDSKVNSFNYDLNSLKINFGGLESRFNSLDSEVKKLEKPSTRNGDTDNFILNPLQEDLDLGGYNITDQEAGNINVNGTICDVNGCIGDSSFDYVNNPMTESLDANQKLIFNIEIVNANIGSFGRLSITNPEDSNLGFPGIGVSMQNHNAAAIMAGAEGDDSYAGYFVSNGDNSYAGHFSSSGDDSSAGYFSSSGNDSYAGNFNGHVKISGNTGMYGNLQVGTDGSSLMPDGGSIQAINMYTSGMYINGGLQVSAMDDNPASIASNFSGTTQFNDLVKFDDEVIFSDIVNLNGGLNVYGPGPIPEDEAPFNLAADFIGSVKIKSNLQVGPDSSGLMPSDGGIKAINMYTSGMYISGGLQVSAMYDDPASIASNFSGTTQFNDLVKFYDNVSIYNGNLGIGTYSPNKQLHIKTSNNEGNAEIDIQSGYNNHWGIYQEVDGGDLKFWHVNDRVVFTDEGIETNKIDLEEVCLNGVCIDNWRDLQRMLNINY